MDSRNNLLEKTEAFGRAGALQDTVYRNAIDYFEGTSVETTFPFPEKGDVSRLLREANETLENYLGSVRNKDQAHQWLLDWHILISNKITEYSLDESQTKKLIEQIYTNLFIAQNPTHDMNKRRRMCDETGAPNGKTPGYNFNRAEKLNNEISHWKGWKVVGGIGLMFLGAVLVIGASLAIASGYDTVVSSAIAPFVNFVASFNGELFAAALAYMGGSLYNQCKQYRRSEQRMAAGFEQSRGPQPVSTSRMLAEMLMGNEDTWPLSGREKAARFASFMAPFMTPFMTVAGCDLFHSPSASLSLAKGVAAKVTWVHDAMPGSGLHQLGVGSIMSAMMLVIVVGLRAGYQGYKLVKGERETALKDRESRVSANSFLKAISGDKTVGVPPSRAGGLQPRSPAR